MKDRSKKSPPIFLDKYFWDIDFDKLDPTKHPQYVISRILEYGDKKAVRWMMRNFKKPQIKKTLLKRRGFSRRSANYWSLIFNVSKDRILCLKKSYQQRQKTHWPY